MKKIIKVIIAIILIACQAVLAINISIITGEIINVGLIKKGIDEPIPFFVMEEHMNYIEKYFDKDKELMNFYGYIPKENAKKLNSYKIKNKMAVYVLKDNIDKESAKEKIYSIIKPIVIVENLPVRLVINNKLSEILDKDKYKLVTSALSKYNYSKIDQILNEDEKIEIINLLISKGEKIDNVVAEQCINYYNQYVYSNLKIDLEVIKNDYISHTIKTLIAYIIIIFLIQISTIKLTVSLSESIVTSLRNKLTRKVLHISGNDMNKIGLINLSNIINVKIKNIENNFPTVIKEMVYSPIVLIYGLYIVNLKTNYTITISMLIGILLSVALIIILLAFAAPKSRSNKKIEEVTNKKIKNLFDGIVIIKSFLQEKRELLKIKELINKSKKKYIFINRIISLILPILILLLGAGLGTIYYKIIEFIDHGSLQIGNIVQIFQLSIQIICAFFGISIMLILLAPIISTLKQVKKIMNISEVEDNFGDNISDLKNKKINFKNVNYIKNGNIILNNLNFSIIPGKVNAIIGKNASGKSSIINLLIQYEKPTSGEITIENTNINKFSLSQLKKNISVSLQDNNIFTGTIEDNLKNAKKDITIDEMLEIINIVELFDLNTSAKQNNILDFNILYGGSNISGGQKQRIAIANALAKNADLLILDDSFSSLDNITSKNIRERIMKEYNNKTILLTSQKISDVKKADNIIVLDNGKIIAEGSHEYLKKNCDLYLDFINIQAKEDF